MHSPRQQLQASKRDGTVSVDWIGLAMLNVDKDADTQNLWSQAAAVVHSVDTAAVVPKFRSMLGSSAAAAAIEWSGQRQG